MRGLGRWAIVLGMRAGALSFIACLLACNGDAAAPRDLAEAVDGAAKAEADPAPAEADSSRSPPVRKDGTIFGSGSLMGTSVSVNLWLDPEHTAAEAGAAMEAAFDEISRIESIASEWQAQSELSRLNQNAGADPMPLSPELFEILARSREVSERTGGAFDVTFYAVGALWKFGPGAKPPSRAAVEALRPLIDWRGIELHAATKTGRLARPGMKVGLGAIAKGYAVDRAAQVLHDRGFHHHVVEGGGDTMVSGLKGGQKWSVGIQDPDKKAPVAVIPATDISIVTSGDYERFIEYEGRRYAHIFDPRTGWPLEAEKSPRSVTLLAPNATLADAYCTAVMVMGPDRGMAFVEAHKDPDLEAVILPRTGDMRVSSGLEGVLVRTPTQ